MTDSRQPGLTRRERDSGVIVVELQGDLDAHGIREIEPAFGVATSDRTQRMIIDLSQVTFLGSAALAMLAAHAQFSRRGGGKFILAAAPPSVAEVIEQSGFAQVLGYYATVDEALEQIEGTAPNSA